MKTKKCAPLKSTKMPKMSGEANLPGHKTDDLKAFPKKKK